MKVNSYWIAVCIQLVHQLCTGQESCNPSRDGAVFHMNLRSRLNASDYRIITALVETDVRVDKNDVVVDLTQLEKPFNNNNLLTLKVEASVPALKRKIGYEYFPGFGQYKLYTSAVTWPEAKKICEDDNAHLIVMETTAETEVVKTFFARKPVFSGSSDPAYVSVGVNDVEKEGHYMTVTGKDFNSLEYKKLHLNSGRGENYICADAKGEQHDFPNTHKLGFICEV